MDSSSDSELEHEVVADRIFKARTSAAPSICVVGTESAGATCLIKRFTDGLFPVKNEPSVRVPVPALPATHPLSRTGRQIQAGYQVKDVHRDPLVLRLHLWDVGAVVDKSDGSVVAHSVDSPGGLQKVAELKAEIDAKCPSTPVVLALTKCDLDSTLSDEAVDAFSNANRFAGWFRVSARSGVRVRDVFETLVDRVIACRKDRDSEYMRVRVCDPVRVEDSGAAPYTLYRLSSVTWEMNSNRAMQEFCVSKRYNDFVALRSALMQKANGLSLPLLPEKYNFVSFFSPLGRFDPDFVEQRRVGLQNWINTVVRDSTFGVDPVLRKFLQE
eukprot:m51a1_g11778 putative rab32 family (328) ;mRNA; f:282201-283451